MLYNDFYFKDDQYKTPPTANMMSVCFCIEYGKTKVLFTGDLEEHSGRFAGETKLVEKYNKLFNGGITLYKAAHHGSETSNSKKLLSVIKPKYIAMSALANSSNEEKLWGFPRQAILDNFLSVTDKIYITGRYDDTTGIQTDYHGNITFIMDDKENVTVDCSNKDNSWEIYGTDCELLPIHETKWFKQNRTMPEAWKN